MTGRAIARAPAIQPEAPAGEALGVAARAEVAGLAGEGQEVLMGAGVAADPGEAVLQEAASEDWSTTLGITPRQCPWVGAKRSSHTRHAGCGLAPALQMLGIPDKPKSGSWTNVTVSAITSPCRGRCRVRGRSHASSPLWASDRATASESIWTRSPSPQTDANQPRRRERGYRGDHPPASRRQTGAPALHQHRYEVESYFYLPAPRAH